MQSRYDAFANLRPCSTGATSPGVAGGGGDFPEVISRNFHPKQGIRYYYYFRGKSLKTTIQIHTVALFASPKMGPIEWCAVGMHPWSFQHFMKTLESPFLFNQNQGFLWHTNLQLWNNRQKWNPKDFLGKSEVGWRHWIEEYVRPIGIGVKITPPKKKKKTKTAPTKCFKPSIHCTCFVCFHLLKSVQELTQANGATLNFDLFESSYT